MLVLLEDLRMVCPWCQQARVIEKSTFYPPCNIRHWWFPRLIFSYYFLYPALLLPHTPRLPKKGVITTIAATYLSKMIQISSHALCAILIFVTLAMRSKSKGETLEYRVCSANLSCGTIQNIGYPFWGGNRPQFCGHHEFQLLCPSSSDEYASIDIGMPEWGKVLNISTSAPKMVIALERFLIPHPVCHDTLKHTMLTLTKPFRLSSNYCNISLFYSCPSSVLKNQYKSYATYACLYNNGTNGSVFHFLKRSGSNESTVKLCTLKFTVPVLGRNFHELNHGNATLLSVLQKGFEYELNFTSCSACLNSGGHCGSSSHGSASEFVCHCPAGSHPLLCPESGAFPLLVLQK